MGLLDGGEEHPHSKLRRYIITVVAFIVAVSLFCWYTLRYHHQEKIAETFLNDVVAGNMQQAFSMWSHGPDYSFKDFMDDWGDNGYYGPVKSYHIDGIKDRGSGVVVVVELSPFQPFPGDRDIAKHSKTKEARLWVQFKENNVTEAPP
ncbi:MAG TPA: hypothetical protein VJR23_00845 [Candidatus Acidoferrales bacterium]|nr:hypothetical protein [Candidatus Acidoferrales bacterium]